MFQAPAGTVFSVPFGASIGTDAIRLTSSAGSRSVLMSSTAGCYVRFDGQRAGVSDLYFPPGRLEEFSIPSGSQYLSAVGAGAGGRLTALVTGEVQNADDTVQSILGTLYVDEWNSGITATASTWTSRGGRVLTATGTPTVAVDTGYWNGNPVVGVTTSNTMAGTGLASLSPANARPYLMVAWRSVGHFATVMDIGSGALVLRDLASSGFKGNTATSGDMTASPLAPVDTNPHIAELWADGVNLNFALDNIRIQQASAEVEPAITAVALGNAEFKFARILVATSAPSDAQRQRLRALYSSQLGI